VCNLPEPFQLRDDIHDLARLQSVSFVRWQQ
jgi:hypothetical protein